MPETVTHSQEHSTSSPGAILKRCREYHGISLDEAAEATKIGVDYLTALEEDRIKDFASLAYLKGFLRIYATHLGLNADDMMRLYDKLYAPRNGNGAAAGKTGDAGTVRRRRFSWRKLALPAVLLLLLIITSLVMRPSPSPPPPPATPAAVTSAAAPIQQARSSARSGLPVPPNANTPATADARRSEEALPERPPAQKLPAEVSKGFVARMRVIHNGTLAVTIDGAAAQNYDLVAGDVIEWKAEKSIVLELSNAGGVEVELNGKPLKALGPEGKPAYVTLGADGIKS